MPKQQRCFGILELLCITAFFQQCFPFLIHPLLGGIQHPFIAAFEAVGKTPLQFHVISYRQLAARLIGQAVLPVIHLEHGPHAAVHRSFDHRSDHFGGIAPAPGAGSQSRSETPRRGCRWPCGPSRAGRLKIADKRGLSHIGDAVGHHDLRSSSSFVLSSCRGCTAALQAWWWCRQSGAWRRNAGCRCSCTPHCRSRHTPCRGRAPWRRTGTGSRCRRCRRRRRR